MKIFLVFEDDKTFLKQNKFLIKININRMDSEYTATEFLLTIYTVNLTVKFPCKMTIQYDGKPISPEISSKAGVFTFNQDLKIKIKAHEEA